MTALDFVLFADFVLDFVTFFFYFAGFSHNFKLNSTEYIQQNMGVK